MTTDATTEHEAPEFDFGDSLPAGVGSFALHWIAGRFGGSIQHWFNLARSGVFGKGIVDLRLPGSSKAMMRIPREPLVAFLNSRRDIEAVADANPAPPPQPISRKRKPKKAGERKPESGKNGAAKR
jgi:hypothetical protein